MYLIFKKLNIYIHIGLHLTLKLVWSWYYLTLMLQKEHSGPWGHYDEHQVSVSSTEGFSR